MTNPSEQKPVSLMAASECRHGGVLHTTQRNDNSLRNRLTVLPSSLFSVNPVITCQFINIIEKGLKLLTRALCESYHFIELSQQTTRLPF